MSRGRRDAAPAVRGSKTTKIWPIAGVVEASSRPSGDRGQPAAVQRILVSLLPSTFAV
jgi:hypothetical protein